MWYPSRRPALVPSGGSPLASACSMSSPYALTLRPVISSLMLGCVPLSACLGSCLSSASPRHRYLSRCRYHPIASRRPPRLIDTTGGEIRRCYGGSLGFACLPIGTPSHPCGSASDGDGGSVLAPLDYPCLFLPNSHHRCCLLPARSLNPISSPSCHSAVPSPHLPDHSTRGTWRGSLAPLIACLCGSFAIAVRFRLRSICVGSVYCGGGGCLACLGVVLCMLSMG